MRVMVLHAHPVETNLPGDLVPLVGADEPLAVEAVLLRSGRVVHAQLAHVALPVEDQLASVKVHAQVVESVFPTPRNVKGVRSVAIPLDDAAVVSERFAP